MTVAVVSLRVVKLSTATDIDCLLVELVHVIQESKVVVSVLVVRVQLCTLLKVINSLVILL
jgi:hypothetical protein